MYYKYVPVAHRTQRHEVQWTLMEPVPMNLGYSLQPPIP